jgi:Anti-sigma-K factor rskA/Putative zinc-finger
MMSHEEASELLGAYALDAVDADEGAAVEAHLTTCPRCRAELDSLREVAGAMGNSVVPLPEGLWSAIASRLPDRPVDEEPPPMPQLGSDRRTASRAPLDGRRQRSRRAITTAVALAVAAAAVAVVLGISLVRADNTVTSLRAASASQSAGATAALRTSGHRMVKLRSDSNAELAEFVVLPSGQGYLVSSSLPSLATTRTYQLWGLVGKKPISLGLLGPAPHQATFTMAGSLRPSQLAITAEPAGGTVAPTGSIIASGTV